MSTAAAHACLATSAQQIAAAVADQAPSAAAQPAVAAPAHSAHDLAPVQHTHAPALVSQSSHAAGQSSISAGNISQVHTKLPKLKKAGRTKRTEEPASGSPAWTLGTQPVQSGGSSFDASRSDSGPMHHAANGGTAAEQAFELPGPGSRSYPAAAALAVARDTAAMAHADTMPDPVW